MKQPMKLFAAAGTHPGQTHSLNQDSVYALVRAHDQGKALGLFIVADGMGGHKAGEVASKLAVNTIQSELAWLFQYDDDEDTEPGLTKGKAEAARVGDESNPPDPPPPLDQLERRLRLAIEQANSAITRYAEENQDEASNLGTTITCALVERDRAVVTNVGDSRTYLLRAGQLVQITEDHSFVGRLVREGQIEPHEIYEHPRRNVITRSLGYREKVEVDSWTIQLQAGDRLLLCSDGLWEMLKDDNLIAHYLRQDQLPRNTVEQLISEANNRGGADNIGVVVVHVEPA